MIVKILLALEGIVVIAVVRGLLRPNYRNPVDGGRVPPCSHTNPPYKDGHKEPTGAEEKLRAALERLVAEQGRDSA